MHWADGSNCRPSSSGVRPLRTSSTMRCRNSTGYARWLFGIVDAPFRPNHGVSTKPGAVSRGHRNSARKGLGWCAPAERLSRASVQLGGDLVEARLIVPRQVRAFREVLAQEPIAVLVRRALPRAARITEVDLHAGVEREADVLGHLLAAIRCSRPSSPP